MLTMKKEFWMILMVLTVFYATGCGVTHGYKKHGITKYGELQIKTELLFGLSKPDGDQLSEREWQSFVDDYITPQFKEGLTVLDAYGQWMLESGKIIKEQARFVILVHSDDRKAFESIQKIIEQYKQLFNQESVLRLTSRMAVHY